MQVHQKRPDAVMVFIAPPSFEELAARLRTFRHVDLAQIAGVIEDFYGIGVAFRSEALKNIQFTGTLDFNMPIDHILEVLTLSTNTRFNRNGEKITIHK